MRRLRVGLDVWARLLPAREREPVRLLARRLKRLARLVGQVRDRDVVLELLEETRPRVRDPDEVRQFHLFWSRLRDDSRTGRELLRAFLTTERDAGLFRAIDDALGRAPRAAATSELARLMAEETRDHHDKVRKAHRKATRRPTSDRLHRLRIRLRQLRHVAELTRSVEPAAASPIPAAFRRLQDRLGRLHDLDVALATLDPGLESSPWAGDLRRVRSQVRSAARTELKRLTAVGPGVGAPPRAGRR